MRSIWRESNRRELVTRLGRLSSESPARWGKFNCPAMLAHVNDALRMPLGEVTAEPKKVPIRFFPLKQLFLYALPFPKGVPTAPVLLTRCASAVFQDEVRTFDQLLQRLGERSEQTTWPPHPVFGSMSRRDWGVLGYRHIDHHFTQFGA